MKSLLLPPLVLLSTLLACGGAEDVSSPASRAGALQPSSGEDDEGTRLHATGEAGAVVCESLQAWLPVSGAVTSTGSDDVVRVSAAVNGGDWAQVGAIPTEDFTYEGRIKTAQYQVRVPVAAGAYAVQVCFEQDGNQGRNPKKTCLEQAFMGTAPECTCPPPYAFGNLENRNVCGNGPIVLHVQGGFGASATLSISGPAGYGHSGPMQMGEDVCTWHYQWQRQGEVSAGTYGFEVSGDNGQGYSFSETLECKKPGKGK